MNRDDRRERFSQVRVYALGSEPHDDLRNTSTPSERLAMVEALSRSAWRLAGVPASTIPRSQWPVRISTLRSGPLVAASTQPPAFLNEDFDDFLKALLAARARFLVVGAHALAVHGVPRATGDLDVWIDRTPANATRIWDALLAFGAPIEALGLSVDDLQAPDQVIQLGVRPSRIDLLTDLTGVAFDEAWPKRMKLAAGETEIPFVGRETLLANKRATGRLKDRADLEALGALDDPS